MKIHVLKWTGENVRQDARRERNQVQKYLLTTVESSQEIVAGGRSTALKIKIAGGFFFLSAVDTREKKSGPRGIISTPAEYQVRYGAGIRHYFRSEGTRFSTARISLSGR